MLNPAELGGIAAERAEQPLAEAWVTLAGLEGFIVLSAMHGVNGYVRLPEDAIERAGKLVVVDDSYSCLEIETIPAPGGLTYGPDRAGWVGFDTGHAWDVWLDPDKPEDRYEQTHREVGLPMIQHEHVRPDDPVWTIEKVRDHVEALALNVVAWLEGGE